MATICHCQGCGKLIIGDSIWHPNRERSESGYLSATLCGPMYPVTIGEIEVLTAIASSARTLVERIRELEGDVPDSALLTGAYGPELGQLLEALKAGGGGTKRMYERVMGKQSEEGLVNGVQVFVDGMGMEAYDAEGYGGTIFWKEIDSATLDEILETLMQLKHKEANRDAD